MSVPKELRAGDTWLWTETVSNYPADQGWALAYTFINAGAKFSVPTTSSGSDFAAAVIATTTAGYAAGDYGWVAKVSKAGEIYTVGTGSLTVLPDYEASTSFETRTTARQIYDDLVKLYAGYAAGRGLVQSYTIGNRSITFRNIADLIKEIQYWKQQILIEERAQGIASGRIYVRFGRA